MVKMIYLSCADGKCGQEKKLEVHTAFKMPQTLVKYFLIPPTHLELVGHSIINSFPLSLSLSHSHIYSRKFSTDCLPFFFFWLRIVYISSCLI